MASGTIWGSTSNRYISMKIDWWESSVSTEGNSSVVYARLSYMKSSSSTARTNGTFNGSVSINGNSRSFSFKMTLNANNSWVEAGTHSVTVGHNDDGSKTIWISGNGSIGGTSFSSSNAGGNATLTTIARASQPSINTWPNSSPDITANDQCTIHMNRKSSSFTHTVRYAYGNMSGTIATDVTDNCSWKIPISLCTQTPNSTVGYGTVYVDTYSGSRLIGTKSTGITVHVPDQVSPNISEFTITNESDLMNGVFIMGISKMKIDVSATGQYGSTIKEYMVVCGDNKVHNESSFTSDTINEIIDTEYKDISVTASATDSRNRSIDVSKTVRFYKYESPKISGLSIERTDKNGNADEDSGEYISWSCSMSISSVNKMNAMSYKVEYSTDGTSWTERNVGSSSEGTVTRTEKGIFTADTDKTYIVRVTVSDKIGSVSVDTTVNPTFTLVNFSAGGRGIAIGTTAEENKVKVKPGMLSTGDQHDLVMAIYRMMIANVLMRDDYDKSVKDDAEAIYKKNGGTL